LGNGSCNRISEAVIWLPLPTKAYCYFILLDLWSAFVVKLNLSNPIGGDRTIVR
jgi:hypothetical protein